MPEPDQKIPADDQITSTPLEREPPAATHPDPAVADADVQANGPEPALGDTTGMGTVLALGCIGGTLFLIVLGLIYLAITQLLG